MIELTPLFTAVVDVAPPLSIGTGPSGDRTVNHLRSVVVEGERFSGELAGPAAADWMVRTGAIGVVDVRMTIRTPDDALVYVQYGGRLDLSNPSAGFTALVAAVFETGDDKYAWLNSVQAVGKGKLTLGTDGTRIDYEFYQIG